MRAREYTMDIGGRRLTAIFSDLAGQANGSALLSLGNTVVLATAVLSEKKREGADFFPLTVDYEERFYASGQILGSRFVRREGRPSDTAIISGRMVDRSIRPLFDHRLRREVQIIITVLSIGEDDPDILAMNAASLALLTSDIPWRGPVSAVRVARQTGAQEFSINPPYREKDGSELDLVVAGKMGAVNMIEAAAREAAEETILGALRAAEKEIGALEEFQKKIAVLIGKEKLVFEYEAPSDGAKSLFARAVAPELKGAVFSGEPGWRHLEALKRKWQMLAAAELPDEPGALIAELFEEAVNKTLHEEGLRRGARADGRKADELRTLYARAGGISETLHGAGIFYRGETHVLSVLTVGGPNAAQLVDGIELKEKKRFMHHYNFPPFSSGETGRVGGVNRREVGHGALAERALSAVLPDVSAFPYTIRLVSESMSSNGSTSMASVCAGTLALMDGGVPIIRPVAGIAIGLLYEREDAYLLLTDIQGPEDHHGDMDFKVAGTNKGVTAVQLDIKVDGVPQALIGKALEAAKAARGKILEVMEKALPSPRQDLSPHAPRVSVLAVNPEKIGFIIGSGGKTINGIKERSGADDIAIENDGTLTIVGNGASVAKAREAIEALIHEYKVGERLLGTVTRLAEFGAFVALSPHAEGLVHISELAPFRVARVADVLAIGDQVPVVVKGIDERGRISLSLKDADPSYFSGKDTGSRA